ncbi:MAG TPA: bifunctional riboflavin kinase/FAD synthetase [Rubricoccaceae bacterium]|nr:bifunctional riboflavin kinase/FAD synthetase [Rubricoccaceae bacterium]
MTREHGYDEIRRDDRSVLTTGTFDGVHLGHQAILRYLAARAAAVGGKATVVTFHPHPREVLAATPVPLLTTLDERADLVEALGLDRFVVLPFTRDLSLLEPEAYVEDVLLGTVGMQEIVIGYDHRFGRNRRGDRALLERLGAVHGFTVDVIPEQVVKGHTVSSTEIRRALAEGEARRAAELLGRPYSFAGTVVRGDQRGRQIGFPTANVQLAHRHKVIPAVGVYAVRCEAVGATYDGMMNVGRRPTFEEDGALTVEVHLLGFEGDLYGRPLRVHVVERLRDERRFDGVEALVAQLREDRAEAERVLRVVP